MKHSTYFHHSMSGYEYEMKNDLRMKLFETALNIAINHKRLEQINKYIQNK